MYILLYCGFLLQTSVHGSIPERDFKPNNLNDVMKLEGLDDGEDDDGSGSDAGSKAPSEEYSYKILGYFEPKGCLKERQEYSLYIFSETNW